MNFRKIANARKGISLTLLVAFALSIAFVLLNVVPLLIRTSAQNDLGASDFDSKKSVSLENYDIRLDGNDTARAAIENFRLAAGRESSFAEAERDKFVAAENRLRQRVPSLVVEYNKTLHAPEVIGLDVKTAENGEPLAMRAGKKTPNAETLRQFIYNNNELIGLNEREIGELKTVADYTNPDGVLSYAHLEQTINGVPVFQAEIKAGFNKRGEMFRVINNLAPALDYNSQSGNFGDARAAVGNAFKFVSREMTAENAEFNPKESTDLKAIFGAGDRATTAEKMYFPVEAGAARPAWRVLIWDNAASYYVIVDAETGTLLWRKNITAHQTQAATYSVYANSTSMIQSLDSPAPLTPGPVAPTLGTQAALQNRTNVTLIGNEGANSFNNLGWMTDGNNTTDGNNVEAGLDRFLPNGVDAPVTGSGTRIFNFSYTPGNPAGGGDPLTAEFQKGSVTQLFYLSNRYHDEMYKLGFSEAARNFQHDTFGRGGAGGDRISAEAQDSSGQNNANFSTPADGGRGRMQMYLWTPRTPFRDGGLDADIAVHELTHGLSNRLIGNAVGLTTLMSRGMGEGWSDFYAHAMLSEPSDPIHGIYTVGAYATSGFYLASPNGNYYYGIRAFPKAVKSFKGGALNRPHNPLTFADIDETQLNVSDGAFAPVFTPNTNSVHFLGEVWSSAIWEVRARYIRRLGHTEGNRRILQFVTDGMKLTPNAPTFLQARDAIKQAAMNGGTSDDLLDVRIGFAIRGMGDAAQITSDSPVRVVESFDPATPSAVEISHNPITIVSESVLPPNDLPDANETLTVSVPLQNHGDLNSGANVTVTLLASGGITNPSAAQNYGTLTAGGAAVSRNFTFDVPASAVRGSLITLTFQVQDGATSFQFVQFYTIPASLLNNNALTIVSESNLPANNTPDTGETVTVSLAFQNVGNAATGNVTATLQNSGGITPVAPATQSYGVIAAGGTASRNFTFSVPANAVCGSSVTLTFQGQDGTTSFDLTKTYTLGTPSVTNSENFDGVATPALPAGWTSTQSGIGSGWYSTTFGPLSAPNAAFALNPNNIGLSDLESPAWNVTTPAARLDFKIRYDTETNYDGAVLEIKIGSGAYQDIIAAGGSFTAGGYDRTIDTRFGNPLSGRAAWSGNSIFYVSSSVNLPASANGQTVQFRWRMGSDDGFDRFGVWLDDVQLFGAAACAVPPRSLIVNKTADTNDGICDAADCSLREALDAADGDNLYNIITFNIPANSAGCNGANCTITLTSPLAPAADGGLLTTINGAAGANAITLSGNGATRILNLGSGVNLVADSLNFTRGSGGVNGGAILNSGTLAITNSAQYLNSAGNGGAIYTNSGSQLTLTNVTISGNSVGSLGGGIYNNDGAAITATNCTITKNTAQFQGGVYNGSSATGFTVRNTIIADNTASFTPDAFGDFTSQGYNLVGNASSATGFNQTGDQTGVDARLAPLGNYGGKTLTHALLDGGAILSPAINTGTSTGAAATDQRGAIRIGTVDKGAFELNNTPNGGSFVALLPSGTQNFAYQTQLAANNGAFTYSITSGALPNGVSLTTNVAPTAMVALSGTPTQTGIFNFAITATNGTNSNVTNYRLQVLAPTAASVSVSGRVLTADGRGIRNVQVVLTGGNGELRTALSSSLGYYRFDDVPVGETYVFSVASKRYSFSQPSQVRSIIEETDDINFIADD